MQSLIPTTQVAAVASFVKATSRAARKAALFLFSVAVLLAGGAAAVHGQSALDGFDPNANGLVRVVVVQPDGKILIGGDFTTLSPNGGAAVTRNGIARLNPDGTLDIAFDPNANALVLAIAVQADGKILVGGAFTNIGGQARTGLARLDATTGLADSFNSNANNSVRAIAVQADGKILVGGAFTNIGGQTRNRIARLDATTGLADSFDPDAGDLVFVIALQTDGKILVGGQFSGSIGGQTRNFIARLDATTGLADSFNPNPNSIVFSIAVQPDGKVLVGGVFFGANSIGGQARSRIARLDATTGLADSFNPNASDLVRSIVVQPDGKILVGGEFNTIGGQTRNFIARLDATTGLADSFDPNASNLVFSLALQADGKVLAGGFFTTLAPNGEAAVTRNRIARMGTAGPTAADATISGRILASDSTPIPGAVVNLIGSQTRKTITDASGNYHFDDVETSGFYTVTPSRANYSFGPVSRSFNQLGNTTEAVFTGTPNASVVGNPVDTPEYFVRQHYLDFLGREPDEAGFNFWSDQMLECGVDAGCLERRRINVSAAYFLSIEFQQTGGLVDGLYRASYGRRPFYVEFLPDSSAIAHGVVVGRNGWVQQLETNKQAFVDAWVQRAAFVGAYGNLSNDGYVDQLIAHTGVSFTASERDALVTGLANASLTPAAALRQIVQNQSFVRAKFNQTFVMMQYFGYLRRDPDESGYEFWLNKLNQFNGNFEQAEMVKAFIVSSEYRTRFPQ